jgi:energy-coupling factor transport system permease protein
VIHVRRASPLHAARAGAACAWLAALVLVCALFDHPLVLGAELAIVLVAGVAAGVGRELARAARWAALLALLVVAVEILVSRHGLTVIARLGTVPLLGRLDVTLEALAYGGVLALRVLVLVLLGRLYSLAVDPDDVLRLFRRVSFRSALTATLATRMVPVLARDARRLGEAQKCRPPELGRASRLALVRAVSTGALDRAIDVAAALEVRGYGSARRPGRVARAWSRHDLAFAASAAAAVALGVGARIGEAAAFAYDPTLHAAFGVGEAALAIALVVVALAPLLDRRGVAR